MALLLRKTLNSLRGQWKEEFWQEVKDVATHPVVREMKHYRHHCSTSCYQHCINVAYYSYLLCRKLHLDAKAAARAGMLHDLYLYDWHTHGEETGEYLHGLTHPRRAMRNAERYFSLSKKEKDIIVHHMWPITIGLPRSREAFLVTWVDKYCGFCEFVRHYEEKWRSLPVRPAQAWRLSAQSLRK